MWLSRKYPEILLKSEDGTVQDHGGVNMLLLRLLFTELAYRMIEELARHYGNDSRIIGWQLDNEPAVQFDYNQAAEEAFREFLKEKYHYNIQELNAAWGTAFWVKSILGLREITLPKTAQMFMNHHQILDYRRFCSQAD